MQDLINRSYSAIVGRGLIKPDTQKAEFIMKLKEELQEAVTAYLYEDEERYIEELTDLATVCIMHIKNLGYDFIEEFEKVVLKNESRVRKRQS